MTTLLLKVAIGAVLALLSLVVILFRVSPLTAPGIAIPFFLLTLFLTVAGFGTLLCYFLWRALDVEGMDAGKRMSVSLREGMFLGVATVLVFSFLMLEIFTWWIGILIYAVFILIEMALHS
jgi:hypothetical protein